MVIIHEYYEERRQVIEICGIHAEFSHGRKVVDCTGKNIFVHLMRSVIKVLSWAISTTGMFLVRRVKPILRAFSVVIGEVPEGEAFVIIDVRFNCDTSTQLVFLMATVELHSHGFL